MTIVRRPSIGPAAQEIVAGESLLHPTLEHAFTCGWDAATRTITTARLTCRGTDHSVSVFASDLKAGQIHLHTHPTGGLGASEADLAALQHLAPLGVGFAICNPEATALFVAREPLLPWQFSEKPKPRGWSRSFFNRFLLTYLPPVKEQR